MIDSSAGIPRLSIEEMTPELSSFLRPRVERLGYLGEFFQCAAHQPEALLSFLHWTEQLKHALPNNLTETVALSIAQLMGNDYERIQHERLTRMLGYSEEWIEDVLSLQAQEDSHLLHEEALVQRLVLAAVRRGGRDTSMEFEAVTEALGPAKAIAVLMLIGRYLSHALIVNTLELAPPALAVARGKQR